MGERKKNWVEDEVFVVHGRRVYLAIYVRSQEGKEGTPSLSKKERRSTFLEQFRQNNEGAWQDIE